MSYEEEDTCHMRRRIHAFHPPSAPSLLQGSSIRAGKTIRDMSRQNIADRRTQTLRRSRMYARKRECVQSRSSPSPCACCAPIIVGEKASLIRLCGLACPKQRITCARKLGRPPRARPLFKGGGAHRSGKGTHQGRIARIQTRPSRSEVARRLVCALGERCAGVVCKRHRVQRNKTH